VKVNTAQWSAADGWTYDAPAGALSPGWILYFGATALLEQPDGPVRDLQARFPDATCCGCSTSGEILGRHVTDDSVVAALVTFSRARLRAVTGLLDAPERSLAACRAVAEQLRAADLRHVLVLSDGLLVNGTQLVAGFREVLPEYVTVTGGLAADGTRFGRTLTGLGAQARSGQVVAVGFYGAGLRVGCGSAGGWESFGPRRLITKANHNVLHELDGQPALDLYRKYLGERAAGLPATGLLFPLELLPDTAAPAGLVRTILAVDEAARSLTFAGDMPVGKYARLMRASDRELVAGAAVAANAAMPGAGRRGVQLAILVSCVGRRLVLGQRVEEELEAVHKALQLTGAAVGFYSYGEICPPIGLRSCELHNQTMTVTTISEDEDNGR
jgi:hypothetical protein